MRQFDTVNILDMMGAIGEAKLLDFYQNEKNGFMPFNKRYSIDDNIKYVQLFNFF